jgi:hypothetical protein
MTPKKTAEGFEHKALFGICSSLVEMKLSQFRTMSCFCSLRLGENDQIVGSEKGWNLLELKLPEVDL